MALKKILAFLIFVFLLRGAAASGASVLVLHSRTAVDLELAGYDGLTETVLFKGGLAAGEQKEIDVPYGGLALLRFVSGQAYPVILGGGDFTLAITGPAEPPSFTGSGENEFFYKLLSGGDPAEPAGSGYHFVRLMLRAKQLLESTYSIRTVLELEAKKKEFHAFVSDHYERLRHSDMVRRMVGQYFMMHEYVDYHIEGAPATDIQVRYQQAVVDGVTEWLAVLGPHIAEQEILNYCLSLYYRRSMVTIASLIADNFPAIASCPGVDKQTWSFPPDLIVVEADGKGGRRLGAIKGKKIIAFVSDDCPVSVVATVSRTRQMVGRKEDAVMIIAPLQRLSENHLAMNRMVSNGTMLFINDEKWRKGMLTEKIRLPLFITLGDSAEEERRQ